MNTGLCAPSSPSKTPILIPPPFQSHGFHHTDPEMERADDTAGVFNEHCSPAGCLKVGLSICSFLMTLCTAGRQLTERSEPEWRCAEDLISTGIECLSKVESVSLHLLSYSFLSCPML
ncbi:unnamed protein product [Pleuronectes platessa]|uniref:Uncharacterized protein n=1 Tax=Pleuronectes platessa TaxID=8262 RepID=A0A9N7U833_PLEPL|nr:unnamed protein product [Pleuronectes platessa]